MVVLALSQKMKVQCVFWRLFRSGEAERGLVRGAYGHKVTLVCPPTYIYLINDISGGINIGQTLENNR